MKALRYFGARDIRHDEMTACSICGSDLHIYHGHGFSEDTGFCVGHEAVGEVVEIGRGVRQLKVGDTVMMPAAVGCGACRSCPSRSRSRPRSCPACAACRRPLRRSR